MRLHRLLICILCITLLSSLTANAQRTAYGERMLSLSVHYSQLNSSSIGAEVSYGQYLLSGYWFVALNFTNRIEKDTDSQDNVHYPRLQGYGGYMHRIWGSRERDINFYGGGDVFIGAEFFDLFKTLTEPTKNSLYESGITDYRFLYGLSPRIEAEYFPFKYIALTARIRMPLCFNSNIGTLGFDKMFEAGIGVRFNF